MLKMSHIKHYLLSKYYGNPYKKQGELGKKRRKKGTQVCCFFLLLPRSNNCLFFSSIYFVLICYVIYITKAKWCGKIIIDQKSFYCEL